MEDFDKLWNYADPAGTEAKFREVLAGRRASVNLAYRAQLLTQVARAQGLQNQFDEALATLDEVTAITRHDMWLVRTRELLERGRVLNSSGQAELAIRPFTSAMRLAERHCSWRYAIDAVHMIAIATPDPKEQVEWNLKGIAMVEAHPEQKGWLFALYNNLGESFAKCERYAEALEAFRKLAALHAAQGDEPDIYNLKDQCRMIRLLGRLGEAMATLRPALERLAREQKQDGWISEELGECLLAQGKGDDSAPHFAVAFALLSQDRWVVKQDPQKLERLKQLSKLPTSIRCICNDCLTNSQDLAFFNSQSTLLGRDLIRLPSRRRTSGSDTPA